MSKLIPKVEAIRELARRGFPGGLQDIGVNEINLLLNRITELETSLDPFARVGSRPAETPLVNVYYNDCKNATRAMAPEAEPVRYEYPA